LPETPEQIRDRLLKELNSRRSDIDRLYDYYRGNHPLPWAPTEVRDAYLALIKMARSNWCRLIVQAPAERLRVVGLRFSTPGQSDTDVWARVWQGNRLDARSRLVHNAGLIARRGFVLVWPSNDGPVKITPEHPSQVIVDYKPGCPEDRVAGLKSFTDAVAQREYATVWTVDGVYNWSRPTRRHTGSNKAPGDASGKWEPWSDPDQGIFETAANPLGAVPLVEFQPHPELVGEPMGELDGGVTDVQDRINKTVLDRLVTANFASFPQKWATGLEIPQDEDGNDVEPFKAAVNRLWVSEGEGTKLGQFTVADLSGYISSVEADIQHLAATTRTPPHYLLGQSGAIPSGDSLKATETGLIAKVLEIRDSYTESWEDVIRLALTAEGEAGSDDLALSMIWKDPESRSDAELHDAATKKQAVGVPWRAIMEYLGYSPTDIDRMDDQRAEDAANGLVAPPPTTTLPAAQGPPERPTPGL
jgi:hypothetical protein